MTIKGLSLSEAIKVPPTPFPGLRPFEFHESDLFFGRDGQVEKLIIKLAEARFVAVVGTSGSGKSSLVRAGLMPALISGMMESAGTKWRIAVARPGNDPIGSLSLALNQPEVFGSDDPENAAIQVVVTEATLRRGSRGLVEAVRQNAMADKENLLVVVDQFEELFRFAREASRKTKDESERYQNDAAAFVKLLLEAKGQREVNIFVVLTMRSDFLGDCAQFWDLPEAINESQYLIPRLTRDQLREVITGPVALGGAEITPRLITQLLNDIGDNQDQLPVLQHLLMRVWDEWKQKHLDVEIKEGNVNVRRPHKEVHEAGGLDLCCYYAVGGMADALSRHADEGFNELPDERHREVTEKLFKALTEKGPDNREIRRPIMLGELCTTVNATEAEAVTVIEAFRHPQKSFLMPPAGVALTAESLIDISHESLIRGWERLEVWVEDEARSSRTYQRLAQTAELHREGKARLWGDPDLQLALDWREQNQPNQVWARRYAPDFEGAMTFLEESLEARGAEVQQKLEQRRKEIKRARFTAIFFGVLFVLVLGALVYALKKTFEARASEKRVRKLNYVASINLTGKAFDEGNRARGYEILESYLPDLAQSTLGDERDFAWSSLWRLNHDELSSLRGHTRAVRAMAFSPDGKTLASASDDSTVKLWDVSTKRELDSIKAHGDSVFAVAFSPDGKTLASASYDGVTLRELSTKRELSRLQGHEDPFFGVAFSPDGKTLAIRSRGALRLWDVSTKRELSKLPGSSHSCEAFSPDGRTVAFASDGGYVKLWDLSTQSQLGTRQGHFGVGTGVAFSPDGKTLAITSPHEVRLWDLSTQQEVVTFSIVKKEDGRVLVGSVNAVAFSPDGKTLAGACDDGTVKLWDVNMKQELRTLKGHAERIVAVVFSPDGKTLATGSFDHTVKLWNVSNQESRTFEEYDGSVSAVAISPDGRTLGRANLDRTIKLWDVSGKQELGTLPGHRGKLVFVVAFSPDGNTLASGGDDRTVKLWDLTTKQELTTLKGHKMPVTGLVFSPHDGKTLASSSSDNTVKLWDVSTRQEVRTLKAFETHIDAVAFSPDGKILAGGRWEGIAKLWNLSTQQPSGTERGWGFGNGAAVSLDGNTLARARDDGTIELWDVSTKQELGTLKGHPGLVLAMKFSPDGKTLSTAGWETVRLWFAATNDEVAAQRNK